MAFPAPPGWCGRGEAQGGRWLIPTTSLTPEGVPQPLKHCDFLCKDGCFCSLVRRRLWQQWQQQCPHTDGSNSGQWTIRRERVGGGGEGGRRDKAVAMFTCSRQAADDMTRAGGRRGRGKVSGKRMTQQEGGGGRQQEASGRRTTQEEGCCCGGRRWWNPPVRVCISRRHTRRRRGGDPLLSKPRSN